MPIRTFTSLHAVKAIPEMMGTIAKSAAACLAWLAMSQDARAAALSDYKKRLDAWNKDVGAPYRAMLAR